MCRGIRLWRRVCNAETKDAPPSSLGDALVVVVDDDEEDEEEDEEEEDATRASCCSACKTFALRFDAGSVARLLSVALKRFSRKAALFFPFDEEGGRDDEDEDEETPACRLLALFDVASPRCEPDSTI